MATSKTLGTPPGHLVGALGSRGQLARLSPSWTWPPSPLVRRLAVGGLALAALVVAAWLLGSTRGADASRSANGNSAMPAKPLAQYSVAAVSPAHLRNPEAVQRAVSFILGLQPEGSYIYTSPGVDDIVHMDIAHSAIALIKTGYTAEAVAAMDWLLDKMTVPGDPDRYRVVKHDGTSLRVDYAGSWWDHLSASGEPKTKLTRGRAEGVGIALIAVYTIYQVEPDYLSRRIGNRTVADLVGLAARYLTSPAIQGADGRFSHRPDYRVSFTEEGARMALGLQLASKMLDADGRAKEARRIDARADLAMEALLTGAGLNKGMAYDYYALGIWGLVPPDAARRELSSLEDAGLVTSHGVRNWDWQTVHNPRVFDRLRFRAQALTVAPSETFDWAIASVTAGEYENALNVERRWLRLQRPDGGFPGGYLPIVNLPFGQPTSHATARFIVLERLLTEALGSS